MVHSVRSEDQGAEGEEETEDLEPAPAEIVIIPV